MNKEPKKPEKKELKNKYSYELGVHIDGYNQGLQEMDDYWKAKVKRLLEGLRNKAIEWDDDLMVEEIDKEIQDLDKEPTKERDDGNNRNKSL